MSNIFLDLATLAGSTGNLDFIDYETFSEDRKEFLLSNGWDFQFIEAPHGVYFPGNDFLNRRMRSVTPSFSTELSDVETIIRQFKIRQKVRGGDSSGTISIEYTDREDQGLLAFYYDWYDKLGSTENRYSLRKEDTTATCILRRLNTSRQVIAQWTLYGVQPDGGPDDLMNSSYTSETPQNIGDLSMTLSFEHYKPELLNI